MARAELPAGGVLLARIMVGSRELTEPGEFVFVEVRELQNLELAVRIEGGIDWRELTVWDGENGRRKPLFDVPPPAFCCSMAAGAPGPAPRANPRETAKAVQSWIQRRLPDVVFLNVEFSFSGYAETLRKAAPPAGEGEGPC